MEWIEAIVGAIGGGLITLVSTIFYFKPKLKEARAELFNLRFQMATSQLDNTARVKQVKKDIARIQTEMRARELSA